MTPGPNGGYNFIPKQSSKYGFNKESKNNLKVDYNPSLIQNHKKQSKNG